jgi:hypothetical protein
MLHEPFQLRLGRIFGRIPSVLSKNQAKSL